MAGLRLGGDDRDRLIVVGQVRPRRRPPTGECSCAHGHRLWSAGLAPIHYPPPRPLMWLLVGHRAIGEAVDPDEDRRETPVSVGLDQRVEVLEPWSDPVAARGAWQRAHQAWELFNARSEEVVERCYR